ncbi:MAG TPA: peptidoglycan-associated lipoprotein Pal [Methylomirabilota bacterium]
MASLLIAGVILAGCAKRPATTQAAAPAPTGAAATTPGSTPATAATAQPSTGAGAGTGMGPGAGAGTGAAGGPATAAPTAPGPATAAAPARQDPKVFVPVPELRDIHFDFDKYDVRPTDAKILDGNANWLKSNPNHLILIEGHCDERGTNEYNLALGERRAKSTMNYLVSQGVQASRITIISYGEERPACAQKNEECWAKNRRAHFLVKPR